ncbi:hypothetical protein ACJJTC_004381 [Scirpophaga incertulas]
MDSERSQCLKKNAPVDRNYSSSSKSFKEENLSKDYINKRKRKLNEDNNLEYVTKLRHVNTADYTSIYSNCSGAEFVKRTNSVPPNVNNIAMRPRRLVNELSFHDIHDRDPDMVSPNLIPFTESSLETYEILSNTIQLYETPAIYTPLKCTEVVENITSLNSQNFTEISTCPEDNQLNMLPGLCSSTEAISTYQAVNSEKPNDYNILTELSSNSTDQIISLEKTCLDLTTEATNIGEVVTSEKDQAVISEETQATACNNETFGPVAATETVISREKEIEYCLQEIRSEVVIEIEPLNEHEAEETETINANETRIIRRRISKLKHIDFLSDNECFEWSSSSWEPDYEDTKKCHQKKYGKKKSNIGRNNEELTGQDNSKSPDVQDKKKKKKLTNKSKERTVLRNLGKEYITKTGKKVEAKQVKENPCKPDKCTNRCFEITEERRSNIFHYYWSLSKERQRDWIVSHSKREKVKRKRTSGVNSRREWTTQYFINDGEGQKQICLQFLLNTLDIRQRFVHFTLNHSVQGTSKDDQRGKQIPGNKTSQAVIQSVRNYIEQLPSVPSHYCRKGTTKLYLPQELRNLSNLYRLYKGDKETEGVDFVGEKVFRNIFKSEYDMSFHIPRKDKCLNCVKYENDKSGLHDAEKKLHLQDKEETYARFKVHQEVNKHDPTILCTTFDLQKVLNTPHGESMLLYYSMKLAVYNLTFYESQTRDGFCYTWNETEGKRGANEISTIFIQINYLLPGHTFMPVDSMHSVIERSVKNSIIWAPSQWVTVFSLARKSGRPYEVEALTHKDFEGWDTIAERYFRGNLVGKVHKMRIVTFKKSTSDKINIKYSMAEDTASNVIDVVKTNKIVKNIYKAPLPISNKKYAHLIKLCTNKTIPEQYHEEYKRIPKATNVCDVLPDTDIEDELSE